MIEVNLHSFFLLLLTTRFLIIISITLNLDKIVRDSKAQKARELVEQAAIAALDHDDGNPLLRGTNDASTMDVDSDLPSYGELHGRVLGTGAAVTFPNARLVSAQDEEESEEEESE